MTAVDVAAALPDIDALQRRCRAVAMLDAILSPEWVYRVYYSTAEWGGGDAATEIRDGSGNDCFIVFTPNGAFIKGYDHESPMAPCRTRPAQLWLGLVDDVPDVFAESLSEPAFADLDGMLMRTAGNTVSEIVPPAPLWVCQKRSALRVIPHLLARRGALKFLAQYLAGGGFGNVVDEVHDTDLFVR